MTLSFLLLLLGTALAIWGSQTNGTMSRNISIVGGLIWFGVLVFIFINFGVKNALIALFASFVVGAICKNLFPKRL